MNPLEPTPQQSHRPAPDSEPDWDCLDRLRQRFLAGTAGKEDYWQRTQDLAQYDATFAQRIGWKWDFVLEQLSQQQWTLPAGTLIDWGCGSGIATRAVLDHFGSAGISQVRWVDRSPLAMRFAAQRLAKRHPAVPSAFGWEGNPAVVVLSHVLTELAPPQVESLLEDLRSATAVLWVEPGTYEASLALIAIRERLRTTFRTVSPCSHCAACGILAPGNENHWCHHFAEPPAAVFTDAFWARFGRFLEIDLRSLPLSYLVLDRRPATTSASDSIRLLGRPEVYKAETRLIGCDAAGVRERTYSKRAHPDVWKAAKKHRLPSTLPPPESTRVEAR